MTKKKYKHPIRWLAKYLNGDQMKQYNQDDEWIDENKIHQFREINFGEIAQFLIVNKDKQELCHINVGKRKLVVLDTVFEIVIFANDQKLSNVRVYPHFFHHHEYYVADHDVIQSYNLSIVHEHENQYGSKFASSKLIASLPTTKGSLDGLVTMMIDLRSFADAHFKVIATMSHVNGSPPVERVLFDDHMPTDCVKEFDFFDLNL